MNFVALLANVEIIVNTKNPTNRVILETTVSPINLKNIKTIGFIIILVFIITMAITQSMQTIILVSIITIVVIMAFVKSAETIKKLKIIRSNFKNKFEF